MSTAIFSVMRLLKEYCCGSILRNLLPQILVLSKLLESQASEQLSKSSIKVKRQLKETRRRSKARKQKFAICGENSVRRVLR